MRSGNHRIKSKLIGYYIMIIVFYLFTFEFALMQKISVVKYWDEIYAALFFPLIVVWIKKRKIFWVEDAWIFIFSILFVMFGILGNILFGFQGIMAVIKDIFLNLKFFLGIFTTVLLFENFNFQEYKKDFKRHVKLVVGFLIINLVLDEVFKIYPCNDYRFGMRSEQLFFGHPTGLSSVGFFLFLVLILFFEKTKSDYTYLFLTNLLVASTLRFKSLAILAITMAVFIVVILVNKKISIKSLIPLAGIAIAIGWKQIYGYFFSETAMENARGALTYISARVLRDFFPIGTGFSTFASAPSADYYSPVYFRYGLNQVYGLEPNNAILVSDVFWPMILAQNGVIGLVIYLIILGLIYRKINKSYEIDKRMYLAGIGAFVYLFISSTAESAFVNPLSLPLSFVIGIVFVCVNQESKDVK